MVQRNLDIRKPINLQPENGSSYDELRDKNYRVPKKT